jgi:uncharacterized protein (DUF1501 family)
MKRRNFLQYAAATAALPFLFKGQWMSAMASTRDLGELNSLNLGRKLVLIQLDGGNDGLNMVIPISEYDNLANARRNILVDANAILKLTDETGLHPAMPELFGMYHDGHVQIIQGVGYPNANLSHFRSKDILVSGSDAKTVINSGWAGRMFDRQFPGYPEGFPNQKQQHPIALTIGSTTSATCQGDLSNFSTVIKNLSGNYTSNSPETDFPSTPFGSELQFVSSMMDQTESYLSVIKTAAGKATNLSQKYPSPGTNPLADKLKIVANLIAGGLETQIYVVSLGGWDTHSSQVNSETDKLKGVHPTLLSELSKAIAAFFDDIQLMGKADEVIGFVYSEFGRRIKSNDSLGTDHGTTWPAILFGPKINAGITGNNPEIPAVVTKSDNLEMQFDFKGIYTGIYTQWFGLEPSEATSLLNGTFENIDIIAKPTVASAIPATKQLQFYPNPVSNFATLQFTAESGQVSVEIYSMQGQLVERLMFLNLELRQQQLQVQLGHLSAGTYQLLLIQNQTRLTTRFVVQ